MAVIFYVDPGAIDYLVSVASRLIHLSLFNIEFLQSILLTIFHLVHSFALTLSLSVDICIEGYIASILRFYELERSKKRKNVDGEVAAMARRRRGTKKSNKRRP